MVIDESDIEFEDKDNVQIKRNENTGRFELDLSEVMESSPDIFDKIIAKPLQTLEYIKHKNEHLVNEDIYLVNVPQFMHKRISALRSKDMNCLIKLSGILKKINSATSFVNNVHFECTGCGTILSVKQVETKVNPPVRCGCGKRTGFRKLGEDLLDIQEMEIEENLEEIGSRQPQRIRLLLENGLTDPQMDRYQVGNKVEITGIMQRVPAYISGKDGDKTVLEYMIKVIDIIPKEGFDEDLKLTTDEISKIEEISKGNPLQVMSENIAPGIYGWDHVKKAAVLFLARGVQKQTPGKRYRENIHVLLMGDAGVAKSSIAQNLSKKAMNVRFVEGKNASRAGIVATVSQGTDKKWSVEAGDLVLANNGYMIIDEADKLPDQDTDALHGPMESNVVTVSKAGVKANLSANTSIFAAANPKASRFDNNRTIIDQLPFSSTLLSRFDLIYVMKDIPDSEMDETRAEQILETHEGKETISFSNDFMKKYFSYVSKQKPRLTKEASDKIKEIYTHIRSLSQKEGRWVGMPITARHLEGLIRLSEAHAKLRLSQTVDLVDVEVAEGLFKHSLSDFGIDLQTGCIDLSGLSTTVKSSKKDKYFKVLNILKDKAKTSNEFAKKDIFPIIQRSTGMSYGETEEIFSMLHKEGDVYEYKTNHYRLSKVQ